MKNSIVTKILPHILIIAIFIAMSFIYFSPIMQGKQLPQMDLTHSIGMSKELVDFEKNNPGEFSMWTNSMFSGMPAYQIKGGPSYNVFVHVQRLLRLGLPFSTVAILFTYLLGFYILLLALKFDKWTSMAGATAFALGSYNIIIIAAGHITKTYAIAYMAPVIAGILLTYDRKYLWGGILLAVSLGLQISTNHVQITYYLALMIGLYLIVKLIYSYKEKVLKDFAKASAIAGIAVVFAILPNITNLITTYEYGKESIRGQSELSIDKKNRQENGLDKNYALGWSYGVGESFSLLIPNVKGGGSENIQKVFETLEKESPDSYNFFGSLYQAADGFRNHDWGYWGAKPFTSGNVYAGAIVCLLFILGLFFVRQDIRWWLLGATILSLFLSWGSNFMPFTNFFFYYVPMYNKFRTVEMALVIASFTIPLMGFLALKEIIEKPEILKQKVKFLYISIGITAGMALLFTLMPKVFFSFIADSDADLFNMVKQQAPQYTSQIDKLITDITNARVSIFRADAVRSLIFILLGSAALFIYSIKQYRKEILIGTLGILTLIDLWVVDKRFLSSKDFQPKSKVENQFTKTSADEFILKDVDPNYRVLNLAANTFNDGNTPYYHKSIGGYHGAKLRRYQDVIDRYLNPSIQAIYGAMQDSLADQKLNELIPKLSVMNMLNTKYIIYDPNSLPIINFSSYGNAWFVTSYKLVDNADEEIVSLSQVNKSTAIIDKRYSDRISKIQITNTQDTGKIQLISYKPNHLTYSSINKQDQIAVFSEIYYPYGWNAYVDGEKVEHFKANYILRAMIIKAGNHKIEFKFEPKSYSIGQTVSLTSSILLILIILGFGGKNIFDNQKENSSKKKKDEELINPAKSKK